MFNFQSSNIKEGVRLHCFHAEEKLHASGNLSFH